MSERSDLLDQIASLEEQLDTSFLENDRLTAENQRLREALGVLTEFSADILGDKDTGLPLKGVIKDGKVEWKGVDSGDKTD